MDASLYDVYLTGKLADGVTPAVAAHRLAALFKSTPEAMAGLLTGKPHLLKRGLDKETAAKYRDALRNAGCEVACKAQTGAAVPQPPAPRPAAAPAARSQAPAPSSIPTSPPGADLQLAPAGEDLLRPDEHPAVAAVVVDTSHLNIAPAGPLPTLPAAPVAAPDISHLSLAAGGGNLLSAPERETPPAIAPDITGITLAEPGAPLETLKSEAAPLHPDISGLNLAPTGSDLLTAEERHHAQPPAPNTDHITLAP